MEQLDKNNLKKLELLNELEIQNIEGLKKTGLTDEQSKEIVSIIRKEIVMLNIFNG